MLNMNAATSVFYVTVLFKALSVLGAYFLGKKLGGGVAYGLALSFVVAFVSNWPLNVTWGANPFLIGFPFFLVCLGLLFSLSRFHVRLSVVELLTVGLLFGYVGTIIISYLQVLIVVAVIVLLYYTVRRGGELARTFGELAAVFSISFLPLSPFIYRFVVYYQYPGHNVGIPQDFTGWASSQHYFSQAIVWAFDNLSLYFLLEVTIILVLACFVFLLWKTGDHQNIQSVVAFALVILGATILLSFIAFILPPGFGIISWGHQAILISIPFSLLIAAALVKFAEFREGKIKRLSHIFPKGSAAGLLLVISVLTLITSPFLYYRLAEDPNRVRGGYNVYAVTTQNDYNLMMWMKNNLPSDAVVLVHPYSSGLFIPAVSNNIAVFPYSGSSLSSSYQTLVSLLENDTLNAEAYQFMHYWNISYVFVGHIAHTSANPPQWVPELFLGNPNFKLVKNFGDSYLFKVEDINPNVIFMDDFEYVRWNQNLWKDYSWGKGLGNATISDSNGSSGTKQLEITAQAMPISGQWELQYSYRVERNIYVASNSTEVTLSFYLNALKGFSGNDTLAMVIADTKHTQRIVLTTPNGIYPNYPGVTVLNSNEGMFSYNLSEMWQNRFNSSLPQDFILQIVNYDFDGVPNVAYVDNVTITSTVLGIS
jgi:hypothetical protein